MPECRRHAVFQLNIIYSALKGQDDFVKMYSRGEFCAAAAPFLWKMPGKNREDFLTIQARLAAPLGQRAKTPPFTCGDSPLALSRFLRRAAAGACKTGALSARTARLVAPLGQRAREGVSIPPP